MTTNYHSFILWLLEKWGKYSFMNIPFTTVKPVKLNIRGWNCYWIIQVKLTTVYKYLDNVSWKLAEYGLNLIECFKPLFTANCQLCHGNQVKWWGKLSVHRENILESWQAPYKCFHSWHKAQTIHLEWTSTSLVNGYWIF